MTSPTLGPSWPDDEIVEEDGVHEGTVGSGPRTPLFPPPTPETVETAVYAEEDVDPFAEDPSVDTLGWNVLKLLQLPEGEKHVEHDMGKRALERLRKVYKPDQVYFFVIKKNCQVIDNMREFLDSTSHQADQIAWFDDEADETVNTKAAKGKLTMIHSSCKSLLKQCRKHGEAAYFGYTATLAACLLQDRESIFYPKAISWMFLSQPSYLGIEHFISPEWLTARYTKNKNKNKKPVRLTF